MDTFQDEENKKEAKKKKSWMTLLIDVVLFGILFMVFVPYLMSFLFGITPFFIISGSMTHVEGEEEAFYEFWKYKGLSDKEIDEFPFMEGLEVGDLVLVEKDSEFGPGDVILYENSLIDGKYPSDTKMTMHRAISKTDSTFSSVGDKYLISENVGQPAWFKRLEDGTMVKYNRIDRLSEEEKEELEELPAIEFHSDGTMPLASYVGKSILRIPRVGYFWLSIRCMAKDDCVLRECLFEAKCKTIKEMK